MTIYWVKFSKIYNKDVIYRDSSGCVEADDEMSAMVAARIAGYGEPVKAERLPYPADPRLIKKEREWDGKKYYMPSFCYKPTQCKGKTSCPMRLSCVD